MDVFEVKTERNRHLIKHWVRDRKRSKQAPPSTPAEQTANHELLIASKEEDSTPLTEDYADAVANIVGRLGVKARAAGISLVFAAQRPDANVMPMQRVAQGFLGVPGLASPRQHIAVLGPCRCERADCARVGGLQFRITLGELKGLFAPYDPITDGNVAALSARTETTEPHGAELDIEGRVDEVYCAAEMSTIVARTKRRRYSEASLEAGDRLLKAVKEKLLREKGDIDYATLRREGYSEAMIARLKAI